MSRSVAIPPNAIATVYLDGREVDSEEFQSWIDRIRELIYSAFPLATLTECDYHCGNGVHVILEGYTFGVTVSEYNGIIAVCLTKASHFFLEPEQRVVINRFRSALEVNHPNSLLQYRGTCSNGEAIFALANGSVITSREGRVL